MRPSALSLFFFLSALACDRPSVPLPAPAASAEKPAGEDLGNVMAMIGRRFELAGQAAAGGRFELAEFEAHEIGEVFEDDVPKAELPKEGPTSHIVPMAKAFLETNAPELEKAAKTRDLKAFTTAFEHTAAACNACHTASQKAFIEVPAVPGKRVPDVTPLGAPPK
jgi:hypothetical protein